MRIHSNILTSDHVYDIVGKHANVADRSGLDPIVVAGMALHGSRSRAAAFEVALSGNGVNGGAYGNLPYKVATWDEWGIVLNALFDADPEMTVGKVYESADHFHWVTGDRYRTLTPDAQHLRHNWLSGDAGGRSVGGSYYVQSCKCGAIVRRLARGRTFSADIVHEFDGVV